MHPSKPLIIILALLMSACSSSSFGGLSGTKAPEKKKQTVAKEDDEELSGEGEPEDKETDQADKPVEVAGAFLTVACAPTAKKSTNSDTRVFGCAVVDTTTKTKVEGAEIKRLVFSFHAGEAVEATLEEAQPADPWHVYTTLNVARVPDLKDVKADAIANGTPLALGSSTITEYDPENLAQTVNLRPLNLIPVNVSSSNFKSEGNKAIDHDPNTVWAVLPDEDVSMAWVTYRFEGPTKIKRVDVDFCEELGGVFELIAATNEGSLSLHSDAVTLREYDDGIQVGPQTIDVDPGKRDMPFLYLNFKLHMGAAHRVCLNGINVYGERVQDQSQ